MKTLSPTPARKPRKAQIRRVWIEHKPEESPDLSYLGEYSDIYCDDYILVAEGRFCRDWPADAQVSVSVGRHGYQYFIPGNHWPHNPKGWAHVTGKELAEVVAKYGSIENADKFYAMEDFRRMEAYNAGSWHMLGIIAKCEIVTPAGIIQTLRSGGLWSVGSDSGAEYIASIETEQLSELRAELESLGIGPRAITHAFKEVEKSA